MVAAGLDAIKTWLSQSYTTLLPWLATSILTASGHSWNTLRYAVLFLFVGPPSPSFIFVGILLGENAFYRSKECCSQLVLVPAWYARHGLSNIVLVVVHCPLTIPARFHKTNDKLKAGERFINIFCCQCCCCCLEQKAQRKKNGEMKALAKKKEKLIVS